MSLASFADLMERADRRAPRWPVVAVGGADPTVLQALTTAAQRGWVRPIVSGARAEIEQVAAQEGLSLDGFELLDTEDPAGEAVAAVRAGRAVALMKGQIATPLLMKAVLAQDTGLRTGRTIAQVVLMEILRDARSFLMTDTGITVAPTVKKRWELVEQTALLAHRLAPPARPADWRPQIALMSATEKPTDAIPDSIESAQLAAEFAARPPSDEFNANVAGPLSFDLAYAATAGERKRLTGEGIGSADVMVFPTLTAANLTVKAIMYTADCRFGGLLIGAACPIVFMSRADDTATRLHSLALTLATMDTSLA